MWGLLNIHKPHDVTSRDVVDHVQRLVRPHQAGHAGTLDPLATGVLVVCVGAATRLIEFVQGLPKTYVATFLLGRSSETEDIESPALELACPPVPTRDELTAVLPRFLGEILQRPPAYSALKVQGRRAYALARRGQTVELAPRPVVIHRLTLQRYEYPELTMEVQCGSGTYIRSLGRDIAIALGTAAVMSALERTAIGGFLIQDACTLEQLTARRWRPICLPATRAVEHLPRLQLTAQQAEEIAHGRVIPGIAPGDAPLVVAVDAAGTMLGLLRTVAARRPAAASQLRRAIRTSSRVEPAIPCMLAHRAGGKTRCTG